MTYFWIWLTGTFAASFLFGALIDPDDVHPAKGLVGVILWPWFIALAIGVCIKAAVEHVQAWRKA